MLLRKLVAAFCPLLLLVGVCLIYRALDGWLGSGMFLSFAIKGVVLGAALGLVLPAAGIRAYANGLTRCLFVGAGVLLAVLLYQSMESSGAVHVPLLRSILGLNGQVVLVEGAAMGYMTCLGLLYRRG